MHKPGKSNVVDDALPKLGTLECGATSVEHQGLKIFQVLEQEYKKDEKTNENLKNIDTHPEFRVLQNKLYYIGNRQMQLYLLEGNCRDLILDECHDAHYASHLGVKKTTELIQRDFYWPTL